MHMLRFNIVRCVFLLFYVLMKHIILYVWIQWCNKTTQILRTLRGGQGLQIKSFLTGKRGKKEVAATVLIKTIKYYENTKYTLKKGKQKIVTIVMCLSSSRKCKFFFYAIEMHCKRNINAECECIAKSMVTFLKFPLTCSMKFIKTYSIK